MAAIFISYAHADYAFVRGFADQLRDAHFLVWLDRNKAVEGNGINPGKDWQEEIKKGIEQSGAVIYVVSPASLASEYVKKEIDAANAAHKPIFYYIYQVEIDSLPSEILEKQLLKASDPNALNQLIEELNKINDVFDSSLSKTGMANRADLTFAAAKELVSGAWEDSTSNGKKVIRLIGLPFMRTRYCQVYLVGQPESTLAWQRTVQVALQFTGDYPDSGFFKEIATSLITPTNPDFVLHMLLIRGPIQVVKGQAKSKQLEYALNTDEPDQWEDALSAAQHALTAYGDTFRLREVQIFAKAPVALMYEWGKRRARSSQTTDQYQFYHYDRTRIEDRYVCVFSDNDK